MRNCNCVTAPCAAGCCDMACCGKLVDECSMLAVLLVLTHVVFTCHAVINRFFSECVTPPPPPFLHSPPPHSVPLSSDKARQSPPVPTGASYYLTYTGTQGRLALTQGKSFGPITQANKSKLEKKRTR